MRFSEKLKICACAWMREERESGSLQQFMAGWGNADGGERVKERGLTQTVAAGRVSLFVTDLLREGANESRRGRGGSVLPQCAEGVCHA